MRLWLPIILMALLPGCPDDGETPTPDHPPAPSDGTLIFPDGPGIDGTPDVAGADGPISDSPTSDALAADLPPPDQPPQPLQVTCDGSPKSGPPPLVVSFTSQVTGGSASPGFAWDFGDGATDIAPQPGHTYNDVGAYLVGLTVTSGPETDGCSVQVSVALDKQVQVPGGGGSALISFSSRQGQTLRITLVGDTSLVPYAYLEAPDSSGSYMPPISTAQGGTNTGQLTLTQTGPYDLTVFDAASIGGVIQVAVEPI